MALPDWILGVLFRPGETFERARTEMSLSYWWIVLSVLTIEGVLWYYSPQIQSMVPTPSADLVVFSLAIQLMSIYAAQTLCLFSAAWFFGWPISLAEAMKYSGLMWSLFLLEDMITFYSFLKDQRLLLFWITFPFLAWRLAVQTAGVRRLTSMPLWRSILLVLVANLPWQGYLIYRSYMATFHG